MKSIILALAIFAVSMSCSQKQESKNTTAETKAVEKHGLNVGDEAVNFNLKGIDDKSLSLNGLEGNKGVILIFTCNHCPYAVAYEDRIIALDKMYKEKSYPVIAINPNDPSVQPEDSFELMKQRAEEKQFTFPYLFDNGQNIYPAYGATKTPHVYLLNKEQGKYIVKYIGAIDDNYKDADAAKKHFVQDAVNALINNQEITTTTTKAVGCSIKATKA
ncbi:thioredoxin family protein [Flammeovirga kamogawensis]|uniref:Thioredoxin family protein n=1 Tax=Flammeovirga kamogawensis TaxID=373891 RepID=A0ABX8H260_9BACT|nr:thioredoxin family protein [Flammeovirga kamogawensis]MBB6463788.1 peroxiredoxin [Flammeovirga kamogawensis]QWG09704.1 thioredoxin family protein [Flammeovirga kamogawensis]TRX65215.1 thioredoxin family protein [Flammeovirga kamogawensis]